MTNSAHPKIIARKENIATMRHLNGQVVMAIGHKQYTVRNPDGSLTHRSNHEHMQTVDGTMWSPLMLLEKPPVHVGICQQCRTGTSWFKNETSHGIVIMDRARECDVCATLCCPSHCKLGRDGRWRCVRHHRWHLVMTLLIRPLFFQRKD